MSSALDFLKLHTTVVADTGDFESIKTYSPQDSTTNPSLILAASKLPQYSHLINTAIEYAKKGKTLEERVSFAKDKLAVLFGSEILKIIPGRVSTEVDARVEKQVEIAKRLISMYAEMDIPQDRILIKLSSTWEGIQAAKILESEHKIHCNLTLMFSLCQAIACAEAGVTLISPFVGRIADWYKAKSPDVKYTRETDPGVNSVKSIYNYYKINDYKTEVMGASFRNVDQIMGLVGCDLLTISPKLLNELGNMSGESSVVLDVTKAKSSENQHLLKKSQSLSEEEFRYQLNADQMATEKLSEGIRFFVRDSIALDDFIRPRLE